MLKMKFKIDDEIMNTVKGAAYLSAAVAQAAVALMKSAGPCNCYDAPKDAFFARHFLDMGTHYLKTARGEGNE